MGVKKQLLSLLNEIYLFLGIDLSEEGERQSRSSFLDPTAVIEDIKTVCIFRSFSASDKASKINSIIFSGDRGVLQWLHSANKANVDASDVQMVNKAKDEMLDFLIEYVRNYRDSCENYSKDIWFGLLRLYKAETGSSARTRVVAAMIAICELRYKSASAEAWTIREIQASLYRDLIMTKKAYSGLKAKVLMLLGRFIEIYYEDIGDKIMDVFTYYVDILRFEIVMTMQSKSIKSRRKPDMQLIAASMLGISWALSGIESFQRAARKEDIIPTFGGYWKKNSADIFEYAVNAIEEVSLLTSRYNTVKAGVSLLSEHADLFKPNLLTNLRQVVRVSLDIAQHANLDVRRIGTELVDRIIEVVGIAIADDSSDVPAARKREVLSYLLAEMSNLMLREKAAQKEARGEKRGDIAVFIRSGAIAMRGVGRLAPAIQKILGAEQLDIIINNILLSSTAAFSNVEDDNVEDTSRHLVSFMDAFGTLIYSFSTADVDFRYLSFAESSTAFAFHVFPNLLPSSKLSISFSFTRMIVFLHCVGGNLLKQFLSSIAYQAIVLTLTQQSLDVIASLQSEDEDKEVSSYEASDTKNIWEYILTCKVSSLRGLSILEKKFDLDVVQDSVRELLLDELVSSSMKLISQLDIRYQLMQDEEEDDGSVGQGERQVDFLVQSATALEMLHPINRKDYSIFLNLIGFLVKILKISGSRKVIVENWGLHLVKEFVAYCTKFPLISWFYKVLRGLVDEEVISSASEDDIRQLQRFISDCCERVSTYEGELRTSVVSFVLSVPRELIGLSELSSPLAVSLQLTGSSNILIIQALDTLLDNICEVRGLGVYLPVLVGLVFNVLVHFRKPKILDEYDLPFDIAQDIQRRKRRQHRKGKLVGTSEESEEGRILKKAMRVIGLLGGQASEILGQHEGNIKSSESGIMSVHSFAFRNTEDLLLQIPFPGGRAIVNAGKLLQSLVDISKGSADRRLRVASSEMLHAIVVLAVGSGDFDVVLGRGQESLFGCLLELSCNSERVTRQLFQQLVFQIIHLLSSEDSSNMVRMIESLYSQLYSSVESESSLRDFCSKCVAEHFISAYDASAGSSDDSISSLTGRVLETLSHHLVHPDPFHRLGAAMCLTKIAISMRNNVRMLREFSLSIIKACVNLFIQNDSLADNQGRWSYVIAEKAELETFYCLKEISRNLVKFIADISTAVPMEELEEVIELLFETFNISNAETGRVVCMSVWWRIVTSVSKISPIDWLQRYRAKLMETDDPNIRKYVLFSPETAEFPSLEGDSDPRLLVSRMRSIQRVLHIFKWAKQKYILVRISPKALSLVAEVLVLFTPTDSGRYHDELADNAVGVNRYSRVRATLLYHSLNFLRYYIETHGTSQLEHVDLSSVLQISLRILLGNRKLPQLTVDASIKGKLIDISRDILDCMLRHIHDVTVDLSPSILQEIFSSVIGELAPLLETGRIGSEDSRLSGMLEEFTNGLFIVSKIGNEQDKSMWRGILANVLPSSPVELLSTALSSVAAERTQAKLNKNTIGLSLVRLASLSGLTADILLDKADESGGVLFSRFSEAFLDEFAFNPNFLERLCQRSAHSKPLFAILLDIVDYGKLHCPHPGRNFVTDRILKSLGVFSEILDGGLPDELSRVILLLRALFSSLNRIQLERLPQDLSGNLIDLYYMSLSQLADIRDQRFAHLKAEMLSGVLQVLGTVLRLISISPVHDRLDRESSVVKHVLTICHECFPINSRDIPENSPQFSQYKTHMGLILDALSDYPSGELLAASLIFLREGHSHAFSEVLTSKMQKFVSRPMDERAIFDVLWREQMDSSLPHDVRIGGVSFVLFPFLYARSPQVVVELAKKVLSDYLPISREREKSSFTHEKLLTMNFFFDCVETFYRILPPTMIRRDLNPFLYGLSGVGKIQDDKLKGNELTSELIKCAHMWKTGKIVDLATLLNLPFSGESPEKTLYRSLRGVCCSAYNALCAIMISTQRKEQFFDVFLFKDDGSMWDNLIDPTEVISLVVEAETDLLAKWRRMKSRMSHKHARRGKNREKQSDEDRSGTSGDVRYLNSQYIADSSLSDTMPVLGSFFLVQRATHEEKKKEPPKPPSQSEEANEDVEEGGADQMAMDELNSHPIMEPLLRTIDHMEALFEYSKKKEIPKFVEHLAELMSSHEEGKSNARLFFSKIIVNRPVLFGHWSTLLLTPLCQVIVSGGGGKEFHFHARDVSLVIVEWMKGLSSTGGITQSHIESLSLLVMHLSKFIPHARNYIVRENLDIIKKLVEMSRQWLVVDRSVPFDFLKSQRREDVLVGMQLLGVFVANGLPLYNVKLDSPLVDERMFFETLARLVGDRSSIQSKSAAELAGLSISSHYRQLKEEGDSTTDMEGLEGFDVGEFSMLIHREVENILERGAHDKFVSVVYRIGLHYKPFVVRYFEKIMSVIGRVYGSLRHEALSSILWCVESNIALAGDEIFVYLRPILREFLSKDDRNVQLTMLLLLRRLIPSLNHRKVFEFLELMLSIFPKHRDSEVRGAFYDVAGYIYDHFKNISAFDEVRICLLAALGERNVRLQQWAVEFWNNKDRLDPCYVKRCLDLLRAGYSPRTEGYWVQSSTLLLLTLSLENQEVHAILFDDVLPGTRRPSERETDYWRIDTSFSTLDSSSRPLFWSDSMDGGDQKEESRLATKEEETPQKEGNLLLLPASIGIDGESTAVSLESAYESALDTSSGRIPESTLSVLSQYTMNSQLLGRGDLTGNARKQRARELKRTSVDLDESGRSRKDKDGKVFPQSRIYFKSRNSSVPKVKMMRRNFEDFIMKKKELSMLRVASRKAVALTRKYRATYFPDTRITTKDVLLPLVQVIRSNFNIARSVLVEIISSVAEDARNETISCPCSKQESENYSHLSFEENLATNIETALRKSSSTYHFVSTLHGMALSIADESHLIDSSVIGESAVQSSNYHSGITLLEKQLLVLKHRKAKAVFGSSIKSSNSKRFKRSQEDINTSNDNVDRGVIEKTHWLQLARLYKEIEEDEVVKSIFGSQIAELRITQMALEEEIGQNYSRALELYDQALERADTGDLEEASELEIQLWERNRLQCIHQLTMWDVLAADIEEDVLGNADVASYDEDLLSHFIVSGIHDVSAEFSERLDALVRLLLEASARGTGAVSLLPRIRKFTPDLALHVVCKGAAGSLDVARTCLSIGRSYVASLAASAPTFAVQQKVSIVQLLQKIECVESLVEAMEFEDAADVEATLTNAAIPSALADPIDLWDFILHTRENTFERGFALSHNATERNNLLKARASQFLMAAESVRRKGNFFVCELYQKRSEDILALQDEGLDDSLLRSQLLCSVLSLRYDKGKHMVDEGRNILQAQENLSRSLEIAGGRENSCVAGDTGPQLDSIVGRILRLMLENSERMRKTDETKDLMKRTQIFLTTAVKGENTGSDLHMQLVKFCEWIVSRKTKNSRMSLGNEQLAPYVIQIVRSTAAALRGESREALRFLPSVLSLVADTRSDKLYNVFLKEFTDVPVWRFIDWIPQIVAMLNDEGSFPLAENILSRLASDYPVALFYPLNVSLPRFLASSGVSADHKQIIERLWEKVSSVCGNYIRLISEMENLAENRHRLEFMVQRLRSLASNGDSDAISRLLQDLGDIVRKKILDTDSFSVNTRKEAKVVLNLIERGMQVSDKVQGAASISENRQLKMIVNEFPFTEVGRRPLSDFSRWLSSYYSSGTALDRIELPGQYSSGRRPIPAAHTYIVSFNPEILILRSLRRPKRISLHASDERGYPFLLKSGEDLRLDQRIVQLFRHMNEILAADPKCRRQVATYDVIPFTESLGIIEWLDGTMPLGEIMNHEYKKAQTRQSRRSRKQHGSVASEKTKNLRETTRVFDKWLREVYVSRRGGPSAERADYPALYQSLMENLGREEVKRGFINMQKHVPWNLLRNGIWSLVVNELHTSEAFLSFRANFADALATFSIMSYVLGIGDRHPENFLVELATGRIIGIDFGHAFGTATQLLPIAELVPFRLTPQFIHFLEPLDCRRSLQSAMESVMKSLQDDKESLLALCKVFVNEPITDWQKHSKVFYSMKKTTGYITDDDNPDISDNGDMSVEYSREKLRIVQMKLERFNPSYIMANELKYASAYRNAPNARESAIKLVHGDQSRDVRASVGEKCSSTREQVACLINLATDGNILARMWLSWLPWC